MHPNYLKTLNQGHAYAADSTGAPEPKCRTCKTVRAEFYKKKQEMLDTTADQQPEATGEE